MTTARAPRGAAPVGRLSDLTTLEAETVRHVRFWCTGPEGRAELWNTWARALGVRDGRRALRGFEAMMATIAAGARRPVMHHAPGCACLGGDEAALATLVSTAADGDREDAALLAALLVRAEFACALAGQAELAGLALRRMTLKRGRGHDRANAEHAPADPALWPAASSTRH
jgi:hypothetical protein